MWQIKFLTVALVSKLQLAIHGLLDGVGLEGDVPHEVLEAVLSDDDVVFKADAEALLPDVNARLNREDVARRDGLVPMANIVDVEADEMRRAVHEVLLVRWPSRVLLLDVVAVDQFEVEELGRHEVADFLVVVVERDTRTKELHGVLHHRKDRVVDRALAVREAT